MPLPILNYRPQPSASDLVRFYHRCQLHWCGQVADEQTVLDVGTALSNRALPLVHDANLIFDAALGEALSPAEALGLVDEHFRTVAQTRCWKWVLNPATPAQQTSALAEHLLAGGYRREDYDIMYLAARPAEAIREIAGLTIIPARASYRHVRQLVDEATAGRNVAGLADAEMLHFDDPHTDALLALREGVPVGWVSVLSVGEMGSVEDLYVAEKFRRQGIGRTLMSRALEICARSLFKHVFLSCEPTNAAAIDLYKRIGFERIRVSTVYRYASP